MSVAIVSHHQLELKHVFLNCGSTNKVVLDSCSGLLMMYELINYSKDHPMEETRSAKSMWHKKTAGIPSTSGEVCAIINCSFTAVKKNQISCYRGEKVRILNIDDEGYAKVVKEDGREGFIPTYFLDLDIVPGDNFAQQIRYRRKWYRLLDCGEAVIFEDNPSNLLDNIPYLTNLTSFFPVQDRPYSYTLPGTHKRPICTKPLKDLTVKVKEKIVLMCKFFSEESHTVIWRGSAIAAKRPHEISTNKEGCSVLTLRNCVEQDAGQYWVEAENIFGKCHTVAWITVIVPPGATHFTACDAINRKSVLLHWKNAKTGNSKNVYYVVEYREKGADRYEQAITGITGTSTIITDLKSTAYFFRIYAFNEYFKGKISPAVEVDLNLAHSQSLTPSICTGETNAAEIEYMDEAEFNKIYTVAHVVYKGQFVDVKQIIRKVDRKRYAAKYFTQELLHNGNHWEEVESEIGIMRCIRHRNIVAYRGVVKMTNQRIIIMQWLNGPHLLDYIIRLGYISEALIQRFCKDLLLALEYLHSLEIAHLAIKPENLLTHTSNAVRLMLIDFGFSRQCNTDTVIWNNGAIDFASPEQISHREVTIKADLWSFGIILHVLISGRTPFEDEYDEVMRLKILSNTSSVDDDTITMNYRIYSPAIIAILKSVIVEDAANRLSASECLKSKWMQSQASEELFLVDYLEDFKERRKERLERIH